MLLLAIEILLLPLVLIAVAPDAPLAKTLRVWLIDAPAQALDRLTPARAVVGLIVLALLVAWMMSAPETVAMIGIGDLSAYLDAAIIAALIGTAARVKFVLSATVQLGRMSLRLGRRVGADKARSRQPRRRQSKPRAPSGDADPDGVWALAGA